MTALARQLETRRVELGWTIEDLAAKSGCSEPTVLRVLNGHGVQTQTLDAVAGALGFVITLALGKETFLVPPHQSHHTTP